jgi:UDP-N-acetylmuramoylalanine--D-glutamate ligase
MLESVLRAAGHRTVAAGNVGLPILDAVLAPEPYDVLAVELSSFQLHWSTGVRPLAGALLNVADDHTDWHGSFQEYVLAKARVFDADVSIGNADDEVVRTLLNRARGRRVSFSLQSPRAGELGVVEDLLVDRAFPDVPGEATELGTLDDLTVPGDHNVANALAAAALARAYGVPAEAVRAGLRAFAPEPHRNALVATVDGVSWVDDSKATNPHAAAASLAAYAPVVWVAGGLLKGADVEDLVRRAAPRLRAAVLLGTDREALRVALARHAPDVPVVEVERLDTGAMQEVVAAARALAQPGDTVLLAPAAASMDCFRDYKERGDLFAQAVQGLA